MLFSRNSKSVEQNAIRSYKHQLFTETVNKVALSSSDDKIWINKNNIKTRNFKHWRTETENKLEVFFNNKYDTVNK